MAQERQVSRFALLSVHGCPVARLGERDSGGMNVYVLQLAKELGRRGHSADVFTRYHYPKDPQVIEVGDNARVVHIKAGPYFEAKESLYRYVPEFLDNLRRFQRAEGLRYEIIHSHYWLSGCVGLELSTEWRSPHVVTFHTLAKRKVRARVGETETQLRVESETRVVRAAAAAVVSTQEEREDLSRLYGVPVEKVRVVPAGVDLGLFRPGDKETARDTLGIAEDSVVLSVGRVQPLKGLDILIGAVARMQQDDSWRLLVVGGTLGRDDELRRLQSLASGLRISDRVTFVGAVKQQDLPTYLSAADVFAMPSYHESFGLAALEAMACGIPVVASRAGGLKTFVRNGETGYLIPWPCPEPFAQRLEILLANPVLREAMGRAAREKAEKMSWSRTTDGVLASYSVAASGDSIGAGV